MQKSVYARAFLSIKCNKAIKNNFQKISADLSTDSAARGYYFLIFGLLASRSQLSVLKGRKYSSQTPSAKASLVLCMERFPIFHLWMELVIFNLIQALLRSRVFPLNSSFEAFHEVSADVVFFAV